MLSHVLTFPKLSLLWLSNFILFQYSFFNFYFKSQLTFDMVLFAFPVHSVVSDGRVLYIVVPLVQAVVFPNVSFLVT